MYPDDPLRVCRDCPVPHYENCPDCFGFGVYVTADYPNGVPVSAGQAMGGHASRPDGGGHYDIGPKPDGIPCPTCGSTMAGIPTDKGEGK